MFTVDRCFGRLFFINEGDLFVYRVRRVEVFVEAFFLRYFGVIGGGGRGEGRGACGRFSCVRAVLATRVQKVVRSSNEHDELWLDDDGQPTVTSGGVVWGCRAALLRSTRFGVSCLCDI